MAPCPASTNYIFPRMRCHSWVSYGILYYVTDHHADCALFRIYRPYDMIGCPIYFPMFHWHIRHKQGGRSYTNVNVNVNVTQCKYSFRFYTLIRKTSQTYPVWVIVITMCLHRIKIETVPLGSIKSECHFSFIMTPIVSHVPRVSRYLVWPHKGWRESTADSPN